MCESEVARKSCEGIPTYECLTSACPYVSFTKCENSICYVGENSAAEELISFGGDMETTDGCDNAARIDLWRSISIKKVNEAYTEFMEWATK